MKEYDAIARFYDDWRMDDFSLGLIPFIIVLLRRHRITGPRVVEFACGTGSAALELCRLGYDVIGVDGSVEMLNVARRKQGRRKRRIRFEQCRISDFAGKAEHDIALCLFDSINHITTYDRLSEALDAVSCALRQGGAFLFDVNTVYGLRKIWSDTAFHRKTTDSYSCWSSDFDPRTRMARVRIELFERKNHDLFRRSGVVIHEKGYTFTELRRLLKSSGFYDVKFYDCLSKEKADNKTTRALVFCRKR